MSPPAPVWLSILLLACSDYKLTPDGGTKAGGDSAPSDEEDIDTDTVGEEVCDGLDNDGDGLVDEGFADTDGDGLADCVDEEECDGLDNDGDGQIDEGFDADGDGIVDCEEREYAVTLLLTADDAWSGWLDGVWLDAAGGWNTTTRHDLTLSSGPHVLAVHAYDQAQAIAGFLAAVEVEGSPLALTGALGDWRQTSLAPTGKDWTLAGFDDSAWLEPVPCADTGPWGSEPADLRSLGAAWVWHSSDCRLLGETWFRLAFVLP